MENEHVLGGLAGKRGELAGQIEHTQALLRRLVTELDTIDAAIRLFDPNADLGSIKQRLYPPRHQAFRGEMMRHVMGALRIADKARHKPRYCLDRHEGARTQSRRSGAIWRDPQAGRRVLVKA
jgi:hypothetical protein